MRIARRFADLLHARLEELLGARIPPEAVRVVPDPDPTRADFRCASLQRFRAAGPEFFQVLRDCLNNNPDVADVREEPASTFIWRITPRAWLREVAQAARQSKPHPGVPAMAGEASRSNPWFHAQLTLATCHAVLHAGEEIWPDIRYSPEAIDLEGFVDWGAVEAELARHICNWRPDAISSEDTLRFLAELGTLFDRFRDKERGAVKMRFIDGNDFGNTLGRLSLVKGVAEVAAAGLLALGAAPAEELV